MLISFDGIHNEKEMEANLAAVLKLFKEHYQINHYREIYLNVTLVDNDGTDIELIDDATNQAFRHFKVCTQNSPSNKDNDAPALRLVVDNTHLKR